MWITFVRKANLIWRRKYHYKISLGRCLRAKGRWIRDFGLCFLRKLRQRCLGQLNNTGGPQSMSTISRLGSTSKTLNRTYNLMVLCPRMEWYTLLASNNVMQKYVRTIKSPFNKSALSEGSNSLRSVIVFERGIPWSIKRTSRKTVP